MIRPVTEVPDQGKHAAGKGAGKPGHLIDLAESVGALGPVGGRPVVVPPTRHLIGINQRTSMDPEFFNGRIKDLLFHLHFITQSFQGPSLLGEPIVDPFQGVFLRITFFMEELVDASVAIGVKKNGSGKFAVTSRATDFLIIGLQASGQSGVDYGTDIGLINAHTKGNGCNDPLEFP